MLTTRFGIEIEFTGITRERAAQIASEYLNGRRDGYTVTAPDGKKWEFKYDGSIRTQRKRGNDRISAGDEYSVELVSPILTYENDIKTLQELIRRLRKAGAFTNETCGIHIHLDGQKHTPRTIRNFVNIIASKGDILYKALQVPYDRQRYCKKMDEDFVKKMNKKKPTTFAEIEDLWYEGYGYESRNRHYNNSRYRICNLHSFFHGHGTIELRCFNSELHAGKIRAYIVLALAMNHQALTQKFASPKKPQTDNERFALRTYLTRLGLNGEEFKACREHLTEHLTGSAAWRFGSKEAATHRN